ncbi:RICIN domain-containing protein [Streptomyces sp. NPDC096339]|uniref:RICIN domain-containing protein n=1 Tax=Streptomyces sp. NPDC096339 TaxID=3366086 RepID=UPI003818704C
MAPAAADAVYGPYQLRNLNSGKCLVLQGGENGTIPFQYNCANFADQKWYTGWYDNGTTFRLMNTNNGKCLVSQGTNNGTNPFQYHCKDFADQVWYLTY